MATVVINQPGGQTTGYQQNVTQWTTNICGCFEDCGSCKSIVFHENSGKVQLIHACWVKDDESNSLLLLDDLIRTDSLSIYIILFCRHVCLVLRPLFSVRSLLENERKLLRANLFWHVWSACHENQAEDSIRYTRK